MSPCEVGLSLPEQVTWALPSSMTTVPAGPWSSVFCMVSFPQLEMPSISYTSKMWGWLQHPRPAQGVTNLRLCEAFPDISLSTYLIEGSWKSTLSLCPAVYVQRMWFEGVWEYHLHSLGWTS